MSLPYGKRTDVTLDALDDVVAVVFPPRVFIEKILINELAGGTQSGTVDVFERNPDDFDASTDPEGLYLVCPRITLTSGKAQTFFDSPKSFFSHDADASTGKARTLYFRFNGLSSGSFAIVVGGSSDLT